MKPLAVVETDKIGENVTIHEYAVIRQGVTIGNNVTIHPHVVIEDGVIVGDGVEIFPGSYIGKKPHGAGATARPFAYESIVNIGSNCAIGPNAVVFYDVEIGHNTLLGDGASIREQVRIGHHCLISRYVTINYNTTIGDFTKIMDLTHITGNCSIGSNVFIGMLVSTANDNRLVLREYDEKYSKGPTIEKNATIGTGAKILPAIIVGEGAVIGAGAIVAKDVLPYRLVMGRPAKTVRVLEGAPSDTPK